MTSAPTSPARTAVRITVIGAGLLGGSLLAALQPRRRNGDPRFHLTAVSSSSTLDGLARRGWCDAMHGYDALGDGCARADLVLLCTPLATIHEQITTIASLRARLSRDAIVMDVGSTKRAICEHGFAAFPADADDAPRFVGGHPMAGSEKSGLEAADPMLYQSALWVLCPPDDLPLMRLRHAQTMIAAMGARTATLDPALHDDAVARISHVPQVLASTLAAWAGADLRLAEAALTLAAGGFRDMTRLALSSWDVWRDIVATNRAPIADGLRELSVRLGALAEMQDDAALQTTFADGRALRQRFHMPRKGILHDLTEFVVRLEDHPGALLSLFTPLAAAAINVQDIEILKVREGESGTILLGFATPDEAARARALIGTQGFATFDR